MQPHEILGVSINATADEIKKAYRAKVKQLHPDRGHDPALLKQVNMAYDSIRKTNDEPVFDRGTNAGSWDGMDDFFHTMNNRHFYNRINNIRTAMAVPLSAIYEGGLIHTTLHDLDARGFGDVPITIEIPRDCPCDFTFIQHLPALRAYVYVDLVPVGQGCTVQGRNIHIPTKVDMISAILGDQIEVRLPSGRLVTLEAPRSGRKVRLAGMGLRDGSGQRGDVILDVSHYVRELTDDQVSAIRDALV